MVALLLGLWGIRRQGTMWRDESVTYQVAHRSLPEIRNLLENIDIVHGLYYLLMKALFSIWDGGLITLRLPSVLAMAIAAACVALLGHQLAGPRAGLIAGSIFPLIPSIQQYAQEGRSYALVCALVALSTYLLVRTISRPSKQLWLAYTATLLIACLLHEFAVLALLAHGSTLFLARLPLALRRSWAMSAGAVVAGLSPLAVLSMRQSDQISWLGHPSWAQWSAFAAQAILGIICALVPTRATGSPVRLRTLALPLLTLPTAALLLASLHKPVYIDRYVLYSTIALALLAGSALDWLWRSDPLQRLLPAHGLRVTVAAISLTAILAALLPIHLHLRTPQSRKDNVTAVAETVQRAAAPGDGVLFMPARRREWAMSYPHEFRNVRDLALHQDPAASHSLQGTELPAQQIRSRILDTPRIVTLNDPAGQPLDMTAQEIAKRTTLRAFFQKCSTTRVTGAQITVYARPGHCGATSDAGR
ncbi:glycosyltransferase family 39 protein [Streptomyces gobiensis]|uniref:glycosyltransferase family 39 protein n=1 Tax=Streptomyces gobiensis TaxID=2875706 RepID=UPI001E49EA4E|nr:glycosyltransferase family 39 protein [Streptomyces gobiensis]UGY91145.1 glycosyltransferase family 39 protein [Streptomyces gobiensis]